VPAVVVDARAVANEQRLAAAEVVSELREAVAQSDRQVVTVGRHLLLAGPEQQAVPGTGARSHHHLNVQPTTTRSEENTDVQRQGRSCRKTVTIEQTLGNVRNMAIPPT